MITYEYKMTAYLWRRANRADAVTNKAPISLRIEIDGYKRAEFGTGIKATPEEWNHATQRLQQVRGMSKEDVLLQKNDNAKLGQLLLKLEQAYNNYKSQGGDPTPAELRELLRGGRSQDHGRKTLLALMEDRYHLLAQKNARPSTLANMRKAIKKASVYLQHLRTPAMPAEKADRAWCRQYELWMMAATYSSATMRKYVLQVQLALEQAVDAGLLRENPAAGYRFYCDPPVATKRHLSTAEVARLAAWVFVEQALERATRAFLFCCYTGLSYVDYVRFAKTPDTFIQFEPAPDGRLVKGFSMKRQKLGAKGREQWAPLFPEANALLPSLPIYASTHLNRLLKRVALEVQLSLLDLTHKDARSTFAQLQRDRFDKKTAAELAMHSEQVAQKHYSSDSAQGLLRQLTILGANLTHN